MGQSVQPHPPAAGLDATTLTSSLPAGVHEKLSARLRPSICVVEIEVDALDQYREVLPSHPDIILLDNMTLSQLREAVALRDVTAAPVQLEASGGVRFDTVRAIAETGVDRISVGALTHSATTLDIGLDW